jgi:hypothetical protein
LYEQDVKPAPAKEVGAKASAVEDAANTSTDFCLASLDGSPVSDDLQYNTYQYISKF